MKEEKDPLDSLFNKARNQQDKVAEGVEAGVETRLKASLHEAENSNNQLWLEALLRLCVGGGAVAAGLAVWVCFPEGGPISSPV